MLHPPAGLPLPNEADSTTWARWVGPMGGSKLNQEIPVNS
jgi:hypothetical protein